MFVLRTVGLKIYIWGIPCQLDSRLTLTLVFYLKLIDVEIIIDAVLEKRFVTT